MFQKHSLGIDKKIYPCISDFDGKIDQRNPLKNRPRSCLHVRIVPRRRPFADGSSHTPSECSRCHLAGVFKSLMLFSNMSLLPFLLLLPTVFRFLQSGFVLCHLGGLGRYWLSNPSSTRPCFMQVSPGYRKQRAY